MIPIGNPFEFRIIFGIDVSSPKKDFHFVVRTNGLEHEIAFAEGAEEDNVLSMTQAVAARFAAAMSGRWRTNPGALLDGITYNMMYVHEEGSGIRCADRDESRIEIAKILRSNDPLINYPLKFSPISISKSSIKKAKYTPENLEFPKDLSCQWSVDDGQGVFLFYCTEDAEYWRLNGEWIEIRDDDEYEFDLDSTSTVYVNSSFIDLWDKYEKDDLPLMIDEIRTYETEPYDPV